MIIKKHYSLELREAVLTTYFTGHESAATIAQRFGIAKGIVSAWTQRYKHLYVELRSKSDNKPIFEGKSPHSTDMAKETQSPLELEARIKELEQQLDQERLRSLCLDKMIDIAERDLNIVIRKKSGAKQSKK